MMGEKNVSHIKNPIQTLRHEISLESVALEQSVEIYVGQVLQGQN